jgi:integrase
VKHQRQQFSYADSRGMIERNPISRTAKPKLVDSAPEIFAVDELRALLESANRIAPDVLPMIAVGAFAGLREAEIQRLDWSEGDMARGHIEVKAAKAKSARRRIVPIQPNHAASGRVVPGLVCVRTRNWRAEVCCARIATWAMAVLRGL